MALKNAHVSVQPVEKSTGSPDTNHLQVLTRSVAILEVLAENPLGISLDAVSVLAKLPRSTTHRLLRALSKENLVTPLPGGMGYRLGAKVFQLSTRIHEWLVETCHVPLAKLSETLDETVDLVVLVGTDLLIIDQCPSRQRLQVVTRLGDTLPAHCTASGKALLSLLPDAIVQRLYDDGLPTYTTKTIASRACLIEELGRIRASDGFAIDQSEHAEGVNGFAVAVDVPSMIPIAIGVPIPVSRFEERKEDIVAGLRVSRDEIVGRIRGSAAETFL